ncbi:MAG: LamG domain-containing protein, partial [Deltaproteobacteria bacterium]|nr:LamG domain-containing protein [Deltaproteobacteria bacterium]
TLKASRLATTEEKCDKQCDVAQDFTPTIMAFDGDVPRYGVDTTESFTLPGNNSKEYRVRAIELDNNGQETTTIPIDEKKSGGESLPLSNLKPRKDYKFKVEETSGAQILNTLEKIVTTGDTGLVLWLRFNEDPSKSIMCEGDDNPSKTICDYSGNSNHGIPQGGPQWLEPPQSGILDGAFKFDGTNDQVLIDNVSALNPDSVSVIAVVTNIDKYSEQQLVDKRLDGATYNLRLAGDGFYPLYVQFVILSSVQDYYHMTSDRLINNDIPYHIAGTFDHATGEVGIYLNGEPVTTYLDLVPVDTIGQIDRSVKSTSKLFIGNNSYGNANYFSGNMSEIFIFDRPLSAEEVNKYYLSTSGD